MLLFLCECMTQKFLKIIPMLLHQMDTATALSLLYPTLIILNNAEMHLTLLIDSHSDSVLGPRVSRSFSASSAPRGWGGDMDVPQLHRAAQGWVLDKAGKCVKGLGLLLYHVWLAAGGFRWSLWADGVLQEQGHLILTLFRHRLTVLPVTANKVSDKRHCENLFKPEMYYSTLISLSWNNFLWWKNK